MTIEIPNSQETRDNSKDSSKPLDWWKEEIKSAVRYRTMYGRSMEWNTYKNMYRGFWKDGVVPVNLIYSIGRSIIPQIYFRNPRVSIQSKYPGFSMHAMVLERLDDYLIKEMGLKRQLKSNALDCYLSGVGPGILGYDSEYGFDPSFTTDSQYKDSGLTSFSEGEEKIEYRDNVNPGMPWYLRCSPSDFVVPWGTRSIDEARWFAFRSMRPLRDCKEDPKLTNTETLKGAFYTKLEGSAEGNSPQKVRIQEKDSDCEWVELWQIHDKRSGRVYAMSLDHNKFLRDDIDYLQFGSLPARVLGFNEDPDHFWWSPDARLIKVQQEEMNDIRTMAKKHRRVGLLKMLVDKNVPKDEIEKLLDGDPKAAARIDVGPTGDIRKMVAMLQSHVPPDLGVAAQEVREDVREIIGFSRNQMGSFEAPAGRRTAHEAEIVRAAAMIRIDERRDAMADHLESIMRGVNQIIFSNWNAKRVIDIIGPDGARYWVKFTGQEIKGDFHYTVNPEEMSPQNSGTRKADAESFMAIAQKIPGIDLNYLMREWSRQIEWLDPMLLVPDNKAGRNPDQPLDFQDLVSKFAKPGQGNDALLQSG